MDYDGYENGDGEDEQLDDYDSSDDPYAPQHKDIELGYDDERGEEVYLDFWSRQRSTYVIGIQGTGKTTLLFQLAYYSSWHDGICIITPHGDLIEDYQARICKTIDTDRVILCDPSDVEYPFGMNIFACDDPSDDLLVTRVAEDVVVKTFKLLWADSWGAQMEQVLRIGSTTITRCQGMPEHERPTLADFSRLLRDMVFRQKYVNYLRNEFPRQTAPIIEWWDWYEARKPEERADHVRSTLNKTDRFVEQPVLRNIFGQPTNSLNLREIMDEGKILLVDLSKGKLGLDTSRLLGAVLVGQFYLAALSREDRYARPFHLIVDEFQNFANDAFFELHEEARKYRVDTVIAHQNLTQLSKAMQDRALGAGNKIVFRVSGQDAERLAYEFDATPPEPGVRRLEPRHELSATPWTELQRGGGQPHDVMSLVIAIKRYVARMGGEFRRLAPQDTRYEWWVKKFEDTANQYLRSRMETKSEEDIRDTVRWFCLFLGEPEPLKLPVYGYVTETETILLLISTGSSEYDIRATWEREERYDGYFHLRPFRGWSLEQVSEVYWRFYEYITAKGYARRRYPVIQQALKKPAMLAALGQKLIDNYATAEKAQEFEMAILNSWRDASRSLLLSLEAKAEPLKELGDILSDTPIYSPSAFAEPILDNPRTFADVRHEIANNLARQQAHHAWIVLANGEEYRDVRLLAMDRRKSETWQDCVQKIIQRSRTRYGRNRREVEEILEKHRPHVPQGEDELPPER